MKQESIDETLGLIIERLDISDIDMIDKVELMLNLKHFLEHYEENIMILSRRNI